MCKLCRKTNTCFKMAKIEISDCCWILKSSLKQVILKQIFVLIILSSSLHVVKSDKILVYIGLASASHRIAIQPLATKLSEIGHEVTFLSPIEPQVENPKIKEFCPKAMLDFNEILRRDHGDAAVVSRLEDKTSDVFMDSFGSLVRDVNYQSNEIIMLSSDLLQWMENSKFDLVITEHPYKEIVLALAYKFRAKVIGFSASPMLTGEADMFGIPTESSWLPDMSIRSIFTLIPDRFSYEINNIMWHLNYKWGYFPKMNSLIQETFAGEGIPHVEDLVKNIYLLFVNTHFSNEYARSLPPFVIPIGGMQAAECTKSLPKDIEDFVSSGSDGFVYISFGSAVKISGLPEKVRKDFFDAIRSLPNARFLVKWNDEIPEDMPKNVLPLKWFPQQDILAHPKCRGFISQGGLMSFHEATYHGVPMVIMPVFFDQPYNAQSAVHQGNGIHLELADLSFDTFSDALRQLLYNNALSTKAKEVARRFKDRPMSPVDTAVWWTEYVLRHNDTTHLKPLGISQTWWQRRLLDFWAIVFTGVFLISVVTIWTISRLISLFIKSSSNQARSKIKRS